MAEASEQDKRKNGDDKPIASDRIIQTQHSVTMAGQPIQYTVTTGTLEGPNSTTAAVETPTDTSATVKTSTGAKVVNQKKKH